MIPWTTAKVVKKTFHGCCNVGLALFQWPREKSHKSEALARITRLTERKGAVGQTERARDRFRKIYGVEVLGCAEGLRKRLG